MAVTNMGWRVYMQVFLEVRGNTLRCPRTKGTAVNEWVLSFEDFWVGHCHSRALPPGSPPMKHWLNIGETLAQNIWGFINCEWHSFSECVFLSCLYCRTHIPISFTVSPSNPKVMLQLVHSWHIDDVRWWHLWHHASCFRSQVTSSVDDALIAIIVSIDN